MAQLGNIFEAEPTSSGDRGADLRVTVDVDTATVRAGRAVRVRVPLVIDVDGVGAARVPHPADDGDTMELNLPVDVADGTTLRLRGRGAAGPGGLGDLYLAIRLGEFAPIEPRQLSRPGLAAVVVAAIGAMILALGALIFGR